MLLNGRVFHSAEMEQILFSPNLFHQSATQHSNLNSSPLLSELDIGDCSYSTSSYRHSGHKLQTHHWVMCLQPRPANRKQTISNKCWLTALQPSRFPFVQTSSSFLPIGWTYQDFKCERKVSCDTCAQLKDGFKRNLPTMPLSTKKTKKNTEKNRKLNWCKVYIFYANSSLEVEYLFIFVILLEIRDQ